LCNKAEEIEVIVSSNCINILAISETHLDDFLTDSDVNIEGFSIFRKVRNQFGGGVAIYVQNDFPAKVRYDLMRDDIEGLCVQVYLPHLKPILICCFYRPPSADALSLYDLCDMFDKLSDMNNEIYLLGDLGTFYLSAF